MAYKEKDTKKWTAQWFETNARGEKKKRRKRGFETKREALEYERLFFASLFWTKLQNIFGHCCMSKLDKVAKRWPVMIRLAI